MSDEMRNALIEALDELTGEQVRREWIEVNGRKFPKDWLLRHAARMKANGEI